MTHGFLYKLHKSGFRWPVACAVWLSASAALACSTVAIGPSDDPIVAYSYDTSATGAGFVIVNPTGGERASIMDGDAARWHSKYGSISFNQMGPGMPTVGMNTAGLVVSLMWNDDAVFPPIEGRAIVTELEFIQMLLDRAASVDEAMDVMHQIGVRALVPIHYFLADAAGATAVITPTKERMLVHTDADMPVRALTNTSYVDLLDGLTGFSGFGGNRSLFGADLLDGRGSLQRFALAATAAQHDTPVAEDDGFAVLSAVENAQTQWQIVFMPADRKIVFQLAGQSARWRIDLADIDFACRVSLGAKRLKDLPASGGPVEMRSLQAGELTAVLTEVLTGFARQTGLPPSMAGELAEAQLNAAICAR